MCERSPGFPAGQTRGQRRRVEPERRRARVGVGVNFGAALREKPSSKGRELH